MQMRHIAAAIDALAVDPFIPHRLRCAQLSAIRTLTSDWINTLSVRDADDQDVTLDPDHAD